MLRSSPIPVSLMMDAIRSSKTSVLITATRHNIQEDGILHSHCRENLESYMENYLSKFLYFLKIYCAQVVHLPGYSSYLTEIFPANHQGNIFSVTTLGYNAFLKLIYSKLGKDTSKFIFLM
jgi:hypothetical protein